MHCTVNNANMNTERPSSVFETVDTINIYASLSTELSSRSSNGSVVQCSGHTGLICSKCFQNHAFKGWLSLETMKFWLLVLTKTLFLLTLIIKLTLGNIFMKVKNPPGGATVTKKFKTNLKTHVSPLLIRSQRSKGCQKTVSYTHLTLPTKRIV